MAINLNTTNEKRLNKFRADFNHNVIAIQDLMTDMVTHTIGNKKFTDRTNSQKNRVLDLLWNMMEDEIYKIIAENHKVTKEVRANFRTSTGIIRKNFFLFAVNDALFDRLKNIPGAIDAYVDCCVTLNEHYENFAKRVEKFTNAGVSLIDIANSAYELRNF